MSRIITSGRFFAGRARGHGLLVALWVTTLLLAGGPSAAAATVPGPTPAAARVVPGSTGVFAIDSDHHTVVFIPSAGGRPRPVATGLTDPTQIVASRGGSVFIVDGTRLLKVTPRGIVVTIRSGMVARANIAVDDNNYLFVLDGSSIVKYAPRDGSPPTPVGTSQGYDPAHDFATLTVDAVGNASLTGPNPDDDQILITTFPVRGGKPTTRMLLNDNETGDSFFNVPFHVMQTRDGTTYLETSAGGASGATVVYRVPPGPAGPVVPYDASPTLFEAVFGVAANNRFYLLLDRLWCAAPAREAGCVDDYGVDAVQRYATSGAGRVDTAVTGVDLPLGGISVAASGAIYGAVLVSPNAVSSNSPVPRMLRIDPAGGKATVLATGRFTMPVAEDFPWYVG